MLHNKLLLTLLVLTLLVLPLTSAVQLQSGLYLNTTGSNSSMSFFGVNVTVDEANIASNAISLYNVSYTNGNLGVTLSTVVNWTNNNAHIDSGAFPYLILEEDRKKVVRNDLPSNLAGNLTFSDIDSCDSVGVFTWTPSSGSTQTFNTNNYPCVGNSVTLSINSIPSSSTNNQLTWNNGCSAFERTGYELIRLSGALIILAGALFFMYRGGIFEEMTVAKIIMLFVVVVIGIGLYVATADIIALTCVP